MKSFKNFLFYLLLVVSVRAERLVIENENIPAGTCSLAFYDQKLPTERGRTGNTLKGAFFRVPTVQMSLPNEGSVIDATVSSGTYQIVALICPSVKPIICNKTDAFGDATTPIEISKEEGMTRMISLRRWENFFGATRGYACQLKSVSEKSGTQIN